MSVGFRRRSGLLRLWLPVGSDTGSRDGTCGQPAVFHFAALSWQLSRPISRVGCSSEDYVSCRHIARHHLLDINHFLGTVNTVLQSGLSRQYKSLPAGLSPGLGMAEPADNRPFWTVTLV